MSRGRRRDKTYTKDVPTDRLRADEKLAHTPAGTFGRHAAPSPEALRAYIASEVCPWCAVGPWQNLALHVNHAHGITAAEFRDLAGLTKHAPLCSPDLSAALAEHGRRRGQPPITDADRTKPRTLSAAGRESQRRKANAITPETRAAVGEGNRTRLLAANAAKHAAILDQYAAGVPIATIAADVGVSRPTIRRTLKRAGITLDGRRRRWHGNTST